MFPEEWRFYTTEADSFLIPSSRNRERERENGTRDSLWRSRRHERRANPSSSSGETRFRRRDPFPTVRQVTRSVFLVMWVSTIHLSHPPALPTSPPSSSLFFLSLSTHSRSSSSSSSSHPTFLSFRLGILWFLWCLWRWDFETLRV